MFAPAALLKIDPAADHLTPDQLQALQGLRKKLAGDILLATTLSTSGHPGGSLSCLDALMMLYATAKVKPQAPRAADRDRIVISNGHITPGVYSVLCAFGFDDREKFLTHFRHAGSRFGGHVETHVPGVEWNTGNLGQGISAAVGSALAAKLHGTPFNAYVLMGDGEQQKGQVSEARRFASKFALGNLCVLVDLNGLQIGGKTENVMPVHVGAEYLADGWTVIDVDGHDFMALHKALKQFRDGASGDRPTCIVLHTTMGKGISFMENDHVFHGTTLSLDQLTKAYAEVGGDNEVERFTSLRKATSGAVGAPPKVPQLPQVELSVGEPRTYTEKTDNRSAYGNVLKDLAERNNGGAPKVLALSCDLEGSVKMNDFHKVSPRGFIEGGIQEHHMAALAGRLSTEGFVPFFSTFGVFAGSEAYNQERLSDYNDATVKVVATHCGLDVGEDGPTHQAIDYVSLFANTFHFETFVPCDPNQTDRVIRYIASSGKPAFVAMGRSKLDIVKKADGTPFWSGSAPFVPGGYDVLREGDDGAIIVMGTLTGEAVKAHQLIADKTGKRFAVFAVASMKPFSVALVKEAAKRGRILTLEDHHRDTGLGRLVATVLADAGLAVQLERMGVAHYASSGAPADLFRDMKLDAPAVCEKACEMLALHSKS